MYIKNVKEVEEEETFFFYHFMLQGKNPFKVCLYIHTQDS